MYITNMLRALEQVTELLLASISTSVKWEYIVDTQEMLGSLVFTFSPPHIPLRAAHLCLTHHKGPETDPLGDSPVLQGTRIGGVPETSVQLAFPPRAQGSGRGAASGVLTFKGTHRIWSARPWHKLTGEVDVFS